MKVERPTVDESHGSYVTTPMARTMIQLLGSGIVTGSVVLSKDEFKRIQKIYGYTPEKPNEKPPPPVAPKAEDFTNTNGTRGYQYQQACEKHEQALKAHAKWQDPQPLMQAGADRNTIREAETDGLRLLAWLARFVPPGTDPLVTLIQFAADAGADVASEDLDWADESEDA